MIGLAVALLLCASVATLGANYEAIVFKRTQIHFFS